MNGVPGKRFFNWAPILLVGLLTSGIFIAFSQWVYDDPFITYRYARNLINGFGFVYNPGEKILSTTTPLFTLVLAFVGLVVPDLHQLANLLGIVSLAVGGLFIFDLARTWDAPVVGWTGLLLYPTFPLLVSTLGSETSIYLALCLGSFAFYARKKYIGTGIFVALATLARPDGILILGILGFDYMFRRKRPVPWKPLSIVFVILISWVVFAWFYFGSPLPVTLAAKQGQGSMAISQGFSRGLLTVIRGYGAWFYIEVFLALTGIILTVWKKRQWGVILIWPVVYFASYSILGVSRYFWYYAPLVPGFIIAVGLGLTAITEFLKSSDRNIVGGFRLDSVVPSVILLILLFSNGIGLWQMRAQNDPRYSIYRAAGEWLSENTLPGEQAGSLEVGIIGFFANRPMVDFAGLIQPEVAEQFTSETTYEDSALWAVDHYMIDYLVLQDGLFTRLEQGFVNQNCEPVKRFQGDQYSYDWNLSIYDCR
jgi:hypothetical protein